MKRILFILFTAILVSCEKEALIIDADSPNFNRNKSLHLYNNSAFTGTAIAYYSENSIKSEIRYVNGKLEGVEQLWYPSGNLYSERIYKDGLKIGKHTGWWDNGHKKFEFIFNDAGEHHGIANDYFEDGTPYKLFHYQNGKEEGSQKMYKRNGDIRANYVVVYGERFGLIGLKKCDAVSTM